MINRLIRKKLLLLMLLLSSLTSIAQDVHFSFTEHSNMLLNPGLVGANSTLQAVVNYRNQWSSVGESFQTIAASVDARFNENKRNKAGIFAGGLTFYNDRAGDMRVSTNNVNLNVGYHLTINEVNTIGLGIYGGFGQRSLNIGNGKWASQYNGTYDPTINSGELFGSADLNYIDAGAGLLYSYNSSNAMSSDNSKLRVNAGFAAFHLNRPNYSFINQTNDILFMRMSAFINAEIGFPKIKGAIAPGFYFHKQGTAQEILLGANYKLFLNESSKYTGFIRPMALYMGLFYRLQDALVAKFMFEYDAYSLGIAYDINVSGLKEVSRLQGGLEMFLRYNMPEKSGFSTRSRI